MTKPRKIAAAPHVLAAAPVVVTCCPLPRAWASDFRKPSYSQSNERTVLQMMSAHSSSCSSLMVSGGANLQVCSSNESVTTPSSSKRLYTGLACSMQHPEQACSRCSTWGKSLKLDKHTWWCRHALASPGQTACTCLFEVQSINRLSRINPSQTAQRSHHTTLCLQCLWHRAHQQAVVLQAHANIVGIDAIALFDDDGIHQTLHAHSHAKGQSNSWLFAP